MLILSFKSFTMATAYCTYEELFRAAVWSLEHYVVIMKLQSNSYDYNEAWLK